MALKGAVISIEAFIALTIATTVFMLLSSRAAAMYDYGFAGIDNSYHAVENGFSEQHLLYDQYLSNLNLSAFSSIADAQGYRLYGLYDFSGPEGGGRIVTIGGNAYVLVRK